MIVVEEDVSPLWTGSDNPVSDIHEFILHVTAPVPVCRPARSDLFLQSSARLVIAEHRGIDIHGTPHPGVDCIHNCNEAIAVRECRAEALPTPF